MKPKMEPEMEIRTSHHKISQNSPPYLIAEIGLNHNGSLDLARRMVDAAARGGAHAVKFQMYDSRLFIHREAALKGAPPGSLQAFFARYELRQREWEALCRHASDRQLDFLCSVFDEDSLEFYHSIESHIIKLASGEITNRLLFERVAKGPWAVIYSSGAAEQWEVEQAHNWLQGRPCALLQCVSAYPPRSGECDLNVLSQWSREMKCLVGLSDHFRENYLSFAAVALGARVIEKHFTLDRRLEGPDQAISLEPAQFEQLASGLQEVFAALGSGVKGCRTSEKRAHKAGRRSLYLKGPLPAGHKIALEDIAAFRPGDGISPANYKEVVGRRLKENFDSRMPLKRELLENPENENLESIDKPR